MFLQVPYVVITLSMHLAHDCQRVSGNHEGRFILASTHQYIWYRLRQNVYHPPFIYSNGYRKRAF